VLDASKLRKRFKTAIAAAGVRPVRFHDHRGRMSARFSSGRSQRGAGSRRAPIQTRQIVVKPSRVAWCGVAWLLVGDGGGGSSGSGFGPGDGAEPLRAHQG